MSLDTPTIESHGDGYLLAMDEVYPTGPDDLWSAVTEPDRLRRWMAEYRGQLALGGTWEALGSDGEVWCTGVVTACDAPHGFTTTWHAKQEQPTELTVRLDAVPGGTRLTIRHDGLQSIYYGAGWQTYLESLVAHIAAPGTELSGDAWDARFDELRGPYAERFGALRKPM